MTLKFLLYMMGILLTQTCSQAKSTIFWVSGIKTECSSGAGKMMCLNIHRGEDLSNPDWETFYAPIEGFVFEEGFLKKIVVKEEKLEVKNVPADASSIKYTLVKELEKLSDTRVLVKGSWLLNGINGKPINRMVTLPTMEIDLNSMRVGGNDGCNNYSGRLENLTAGIIHFSEMASTKKSCMNKTIDHEYNQALSDVKTYQIMGPNLMFYNQDGKKVLSFMKQEKTEEANQRLHDIWITTHINGQSINRTKSGPLLEINLTEMKLTGNDGCNDYSGTIESVSASQLKFGKMASTQKICDSMDIPDTFNQALNEVATYKLEGLNLMLLDKNENEVLTFRKGD